MDIKRLIIGALGFCFKKKRTPAIESSGQPTPTVEASGERSVALRDANNSTIITGNENFVFTVQEPPPALITYLHQLPPVLEDFTNRVDEVAELRGKLENGARIYGFFGLGGIGKSDLAKKFVEQHLSASYPDAQFYLDLKGASQKPKSVSEAQRHVIGSCRATEKLPEADDVDLSAKYNDALYDKQAVLFLDNASNKEQVEPLTPHARCAMVITSRQKIVLSGMHQMTLTPLNPADARALLLKIEPRIGDQADKIASLCGGLPQALRIAASTLAEHPDLGVEEYVQGLSDRNTRLEFVEASLDLTYGLLTDAQRTQFRQLAVFPETFDAGGVAGIWGLPVAAAKQGLSELFRLSLIDWHKEAARYRLQSLVRDFADARLLESERIVTETRHALYYLQVLREAGQRYLRGDRLAREGFNIFDAERINIETAQAWIQTRIHDDAIAEITDKYSYGGSQLLALKQPASARVKWHEVMVGALRRLPPADDKDRADQRLAEAGNLTFAAVAHRDLGDSDQALSLCEEAARIAGELKSSREESNALGYAGIVYYYNGNYQEARNRIQRAIEIANQAPEKDGLSDTERLRYLGHAYRGLGEYQKAIEAYELSLQDARQFGDLSGENNVLSALGRLYCDTGNHELARTTYFPRALSLALEIGDRIDECYALGHLGLAHREVGKYSEAQEYYEKGLQLAVSLAHRQLQTYCHGGLGKTALALKAYPDALGHAQIAIDLADKITMKRAQQFWRTLLAEIYLETNELDLALRSVNQAREYKSEWVEYRTLTVHGLILLNLSQAPLAADAFKTAITHAQEILRQTPTYFDAGYILGLATCGLALTQLDQSEILLRQSIEAFKQAFDNCRSSGVVRDALRLLDKLGKFTNTEAQNQPRIVLERLASS